MIFIHNYTTIQKSGVCIFLFFLNKSIIKLFDKKYRTTVMLWNIITI